MLFYRLHGSIDPALSLNRHVFDLGEIIPWTPRAPCVCLSLLALSAPFRPP